MECREFRTIVADLFDKEVSLGTRKACDEHISHCAECRKYYEDLQTTADMLRPKHSPVSQKSTAANCGWRKVAAMFVGVLLISGIAFAAIHLTSRRTQDVGGHLKSPTREVRIANSSQRTVRFDDVRLDSILTVVSAHYGKAVSFRSEEAKAMKFIMTWKPDAPLSDFIDGLNLFDGLCLTLQRDTIFVEISEEKSSI